MTGEEETTFANYLSLEWTQIVPLGLSPERYINKYGAMVELENL